MKKAALFLLISALLLPTAFALTLSDTLLNASGINTTISIGSGDNAWTLTSVTVESNYIYISGLTSSSANSCHNQNINLNVTTANTDYNGNTGQFVDTCQLRDNSGASSTILEGALSIVLIVFLLSILALPAMNDFGNRWGVKQWLAWIITSIIAVFLITILVQNIFNI